MDPDTNKVKQKPVRKTAVGEGLGGYFNPDLKPEDLRRFEAYCTLSFTALEKTQRNAARARLGNYFLKDKGIYFATQVDMCNGIRRILCTAEDSPFWYIVTQTPASTRTYARDGRLAFISVN